MKKSLFISLLFFCFGCHERAQIDIFQLGNIDGGTPPPQIGGVVSNEERPVIEVVEEPGGDIPDEKVEIQEEPASGLAEREVPLIPSLLERKILPEPAVIPPPADDDKTLTKCGVPDGGWREGTYVLQGNIRAESGVDVCLPIDRSGFRITIDCKGHAIIGSKLVEDPEQLVGTGIRLHISQNKIIQHCRIHHFKTGIVSQKTNAVTFKQNYLYKNKEGLRVAGYANLNVFERNEFCENHVKDFVCIESRNLSGRRNTLDKMGDLCRDFPKPDFSQPCGVRMPDFVGREVPPEPVVIPPPDVIPPPGPAVIPPPPDDSLPDPNLGVEENGSGPRPPVVIQENPPRTVEEHNIRDEEIRPDSIDTECHNVTCVTKIKVELEIDPQSEPLPDGSIHLAIANRFVERLDSMSGWLPIPWDHGTFNPGNQNYEIQMPQPVALSQFNFIRFWNGTSNGINAQHNLPLRHLRVTFYNRWGMILGFTDQSTNLLNLDLSGGFYMVIPGNPQDVLISEDLRIKNTLMEVGNFQFKITTVGMAEDKPILENFILQISGNRAINNESLSVVQKNNISPNQFIPPLDVRGSFELPICIGNSEARNCVHFVRDRSAVQTPPDSFLYPQDFEMVRLTSFPRRPSPTKFWAIREMNVSIYFPSLRLWKPILYRNFQGTPLHSSSSLELNMRYVLGYSENLRPVARAGGEYFRIEE